MKKVHPILSPCIEDLNKIESVLHKHFASYVPFITEVTEYILFAGGKRLRPLLTVLCAKLCGKSDSKLYELSVVPEYLHAASLLHDDVIDEGELRRGQPPAYKKWGNKAAILSGDFLYARAIYIASGFGDVRIAQTIAETVSLMSEGEVLQLLRAKDIYFDEETYNDVIFRKTAALILASCKIGGLWAGVSDIKVNALSDYGLKLGLAFQMIDDLLDYIADTDELGKKVGTDLAEGKITLPVILAFNRLKDEEQKRLIDIFMTSEKNQDDFFWVKEQLIKTGAVKDTKEKAITLVKDALRGLELFDNCLERKILEDIAWYVIERKK